MAERSLQPGTGTTDLIAGYFYHQKLGASDASWFAQVQYQRALNSHNGFKPGTQLGADLGYRRGFGDKLGLLIQLNLLHKHADNGLHSRKNTGSIPVPSSNSPFTALPQNTYC